MKAYAQQKNRPQQQSSPNIRRLSPRRLAADQAVHPITRLQRTFGNQAVQRLLQANAERLKVGSNPSATNRDAHDFNRRPAHSETPVELQAKLTVNTPGDKHEQEADRVANEVVNRITTNKGQAVQKRSGTGIEEGIQATSLVQRQTVAGESSVGPRQEATIQSARGGGQPIAEQVRGPVEQTMGVNLSGVRVHDNAEADTLNRSMDARAFTTGSNIFFKRGEYNPGSTEGKKLLVHELTHVVQQTGGSQAVQRQDDKDKDKTKAKVKHTTAKQADTYLDTSKFIKTYVADKIKNGIKAEGHVHIDTPEEFTKAVVKYLTVRKNSATGNIYTEEEAKLEEPDINGFTDDPDVHIHQDRGDAGTMIHESIHLFEDNSFYFKVGENASEGTTEWFTRMICEEQTIKRGNLYPSQFKAIDKLLTITNKETLAAAYFQGKVEALEKAVEGKGAGTFAKWVGFMNAGKYSDAAALFAPPKPKTAEPLAKPGKPK